MESAINYMSVGKDDENSMESDEMEIAIEVMNNDIKEPKKINKIVASVIMSAALLVIYMINLFHHFDDNGNPANLHNHPQICPSGSSITFCCEHDGFGSQVSRMVNIYAYARTHNLTYCATPWSKVAHKQNATEMFNFVGGNDWGPLANSETKRYNKKWCGKGIPKVIDEIRGFYFSTPKPTLNFYTEGVNMIAIHIRRGDGDFGGRHIGNEDYISCITNLKRYYNNTQKAYHIFSEGELDDFNDIISVHSELHWHLNDDVKLAYHHMVMADVLVVAHSTFSETAGWLSIGTKFKVKECIGLYQ